MRRTLVTIAVLPTPTGASKYELRAAVEVHIQQYTTTTTNVVSGRLFAQS